MTINFDRWTQVTGELPWGVAKVFKDVFNLVAEGKAHLVWGADYRNGKPCLVNAVAQMTTVGGGNGVPMSNFADVVGEFDRLNVEFRNQGVNTDGYVSPLAAEILLRHFGEVNAPETDDIFRLELKATELASIVGETYVEPTDAEMIAALQEMMAPGPEHINANPEGPIEQFTKDYVERQ